MDFLLIITIINNKIIMKLTKAFPNYIKNIKIQKNKIKNFKIYCQKNNNKMKKYQKIIIQI